MAPLDDAHVFVETDGHYAAAPLRKGPENAAIFDQAHLRTYTLGSVDLEREIVALFLAELPKSEAALERAASPADWHMAAHTLKGSALAIGARRLAAVGANAERTGIADEAQRREAIYSVRTAISEVRTEMTRLGLA